MGRPIRGQFPGAIYHAMARGNGRQKIFHDGRDYQRLLEAIVDKFGVEILIFVCMPNHMFVDDAGVNRPPKNPFAVASEGWLLGSAEFAERIKRLMKSPKYRDEVPAARRLQGVGSVSGL